MLRECFLLLNNSSMQKSNRLLPTTIGPFILRSGRCPGLQPPAIGYPNTKALHRIMEGVFGLHIRDRFLRGEITV
jgi:hypothetical protein